MTRTFGVTLVLVFTVFLAVSAHAFGDTDRTYNRSVLGIKPLGPDWMYNKPEHYEFSPLKSNTDPQNQHPAAWEGQDWDPNQWNADWTPEIAVKQFFRARIFDAQGLSADGKIPVVTLGPKFYKLSDLDQRRTLKLWSQYTGVFDNGYSAVRLIDWWTNETIGAYTPKGMFLN